VLFRFALVHAAVSDAIERLHFTTEGEEDIQLAFLAVVSSLGGVIPIGTFIHRGAATAAQVEGITLWALWVLASYPGAVRFTAVFTPVHPITPTATPAILFIQYIKSRQGDFHY
jgi:hypothetical protein